jgi:hypothetical protein
MKPIVLTPEQRKEIERRRKESGLLPKSWSS